MNRTEDRLQAFTIGYAHGMLWANTQSIRNGEPAEEDVHPEWWQSPVRGWQLKAFTDAAQESIETDCRDFFAANLRDLRAYARHETVALHGPIDELDAYECAGHDFAFTRNGHGAGFWDRGMGDLGERLTDAAKAYGESSGWFDADDDSARVDLE